MYEVLGGLIPTNGTRASAPIRIGTLPVYSNSTGKSGNDPCQIVPTETAVVFNRKYSSISFMASCLAAVSPVFALNGLISSAGSMNQLLFVQRQGCSMMAVEGPVLPTKDFVLTRTITFSTSSVN